MFWHIFKNRLKCITQDKSLMFWTMIFPTLILATLFGMAFSNISSVEEFDSIDIAVVNNEAYQKDVQFKDFINSASQGKDKLFNLTLATKEKAEELLDDNKIVGYIINASKVKLIVRNSGLKQSIIKTVLDEYMQTNSTLGNIRKSSPIQNDLSQEVYNRKVYTQNFQLGTQEKPDSTVIYFYSLIAMACFYGSFFGLKEITDTQADLSKRAARLNVSPAPKIKALIAGLLAGYFIAVLESFVLLAYLAFIIKVSFGNQIGYILLTSCIGCAAGISFGAFVAAAVKKKEGVKTAVLLGVSMLGSFLSGMMSSNESNIKYVIDRNAPVINYINPVALITDSLYTLYYYDTHSKLFINLSLLSLFTVLFCVLTYLIIRRQKYASI